MELLSKTAMSARDRILVSAHNLFYGHGIRATGIDRIIAESGVTKATFYRHFPSKDNLILEYLEYRHQRWIAWFEDAIARHGNDIRSIVPALAEWLCDDEFRGCAFINTVGELGGDMPEAVVIARDHKQDMTSILARLMPDVSDRDALAAALAIAVDGAIIRAQCDPTPDNALHALGQIIEALVP